MIKFGIYFIHSPKIHTFALSGAQRSFVILTEKTHKITNLQNLP